MTTPNYTFEVTYHTDGAVTYKTGLNEDNHRPSSYFDFVETSLSLLCDDDECYGLRDGQYDELCDRIYEDVSDDAYQTFYNIHKKLFGNVPFSDHDGDSENDTTNAYHAVLQEIEELQQYCKDRPTPYIFDKEVGKMLDKLSGDSDEYENWRSFNDF